MTYSWLNKILALGGMGFVVALLAIVLLPKNRTIEGLKSGAIGFAIFAPMSVWLYRETMRRYILITADEIVSIRSRGRRKRIRWRDVAAVTGGAFTGGFYVRSTDGRRIGLSHMLVGQKEFARMVLEKVPPDRVQCEALLRRVLDEGP